MNCFRRCRGLVDGGNVLGVCWGLVDGGNVLGVYWAMAT
jgi:hypothetical protein